MATARRCRNAASRLTRRKSRCAARSRSGPMAEGDTGMNSARERLWRRLKIIAREQRLYVTGGCAGRSEEHTSELQSLMRISYAVFCLKKKKKKQTNDQKMSQKYEQHTYTTIHRHNEPIDYTLIT